MPILTPEELGVEVGTESKRDFPGEEKRPSICVFDPREIHRSILDRAIGDLQRDFLVHWFQPFSRPEIEQGGIGGGTSPGTIAVLNPVLLISELVIAPWVRGDFSSGVKMLRNIRREETLKETPLFIISGRDVLEEFRNHLATPNIQGLNIREMFSWEDLDENPDERQCFYDAIFGVLCSSFQPPELPDIE